MEELYDTLKQLAHADPAVKSKHVEDVKNLVQNQDRRNKPVEQGICAEKRICPVCGGDLVLRTARKGIHAGNQFYGCSNYPGCRYTENL